MLYYNIMPPPLTFRGEPMKKIGLLLIVCLGLSLPARADTPLPIVASFSILGDMVKEVGGPAVTVTVLVGPNGDTHVYEPTPKDAKTLAEAKFLFVNGLGFEGWMPRLAEASGFRGRMITASEGIKPRLVKADEIDPHAWQDPENGLIYVRNIAIALEHALPNQATDIKLRAQAYSDRIKAMDQKLRAEFITIPAQKRRIITSHDAFGYFGAAYGIEFLAPVGISSGAEPSAGQLGSLIRQMRAEGIKTVFLENMESHRLAEQLAKEAGAQLGGELYSDALSDPKGPAPTYLAMFDNNAPKLLKAMQENDRR